MSEHLSYWIILTLGFLAQGCFSARILAQWIISEKEKRVVSPTIFWVFSLSGSYLFFIYGFLRNDFAIMLGQVISYYIYVWNLNIKIGERKAALSQGNMRIWIRLLEIVIIITPLFGLWAIAHDWKGFVEQCLFNEQIPSLLVIYGSLGQIIFTLRFIYQFVYSKKRNDSHLPAGFWIISLVGSSIIVSYAFIRLDPVLAIGQSIGFISYIRNLILLHKAHKAKTLQQ